MIERTTQYISIKNNGVTLATVLITPNSTREYHLMEKDCITLVFSLYSAIHFGIGSYIDDELFGRFYITKEQMPTYNKSTGGFDYSLQFDAPYMLWGNWLFMLTTNLVSNNARFRKETDWSLTDRLEVHVEEIIHNLDVIGDTGYSYSILNSAKRQDEAHCITYNGVNILTALNSMADSYECEWWVRDKVIYFGKCEDNNTPIEFSLDTNVESIDIQKNSSSYANKIYVFGSTENIPYSYRKKLQFNVTDIKQVDGRTLYCDTTRKISPSMVQGDEIYNGINIFASGITDLSVRNQGSVSSQLYAEDTFNLDESSLVQLVGKSMKVEIEFSPVNQGAITYNATATCKLKDITPVPITPSGGGEEVIDVESDDIVLGTASIKNQQTAGVTEFAIDLSFNEEMSLNSGMYKIIVEVTVRHGNSISYSSKKLRGFVSIATGDPRKSTFLYLNEAKTSSRKVYFNPLNQFEWEPYYHYFRFSGGNAPSGFGLGSSFWLNVDESEIPASYYTLPYDDPSSLSKIGDTRLRMPSTDYLPASANDGSHTVEDVVIFEKIKPHAILVVTSVDMDVLKSKEEQQDGSKATWAWEQYTIKAKLADDQDFVFNTKYISDGQTLKAEFISNDDAFNAGYTTNGACRLAGMSFDVKFSNKTQEYTIVRNETFGAMLPNSVLKPQVGDPFVLVNWNVNAMESLGLIRIAEQKLYNAGRDYINAMEEGQFTFTCDMMSEVSFDTEDEMKLVVRQNSDFVDSNSCYIYVKNGYSSFSLPLNGAKVKIIHEALPDDKISRILGYTFKLDKPYDTPRYVIGETDAYSRLKQIEKQITRTNG